VPIVLTIEPTGWFMWDSKNFSHTAKDIELKHGYYLEATMKKKDGDYRERQGINLNDRISNIDGNLTYSMHLFCLSLY
jgi:hypothetical protein